MYSTVGPRPPRGIFDGRKIARRAKRKAETGHTRARSPLGGMTASVAGGGGGAEGKSEQPRGKMVLSALDEIWIVCYNLRVAYAAALLKDEHEKSFLVRRYDRGSLIVGG